jgi:hypothetical protein
LFLTTRRSHRRGRRFESCQDHKKQAISLENKAKMPTSRRVAEILKRLPRNWGGDFLFTLLGVAIRIDRTQGFIVEVRSSSLSEPKEYVGKVSYKTHPPFFAMLYRSNNGYSFRIIAHLTYFYITPPIAD